MRGFLFSFAAHAGAVTGLLLLPAFSASELPPPTTPIQIDNWPKLVPARVELARSKPAGPARTPARGGGGGAAPAPPRSAEPAPPISEEPLGSSAEDLAVAELPPGTGFGSALTPGPAIGTGGGDSAQAEPRLVRASVDVQPPRRLVGNHPVYPALARASRLEAVVQLECTIGTDGRVGGIRILSGHPLFDDAAADAVRTWRYTPTLLGGVPVSVLMTVTVAFRLSR